MFIFNHVFTTIVISAFTNKIKYSAYKLSKLYYCSIV